MKVADQPLSVCSLFTHSEIQALRKVTYHDVLVAVTGAEAGDIQEHVFLWRDGQSASRS